MNFFSKLSKFFIENKAISWLIIFFIIITGIISFFKMPHQYNPEITIPTFEITTNYQGATAKEVEDFVAKELEEKIAEIKGVESIETRSFDGGYSITKVQFFVGENTEESKVKLFSKIQENLNKKVNNNISNPIIKSITPDDLAIGVWSLTSNKFSQNQLRQEAFKITSEIQKIKGVANINIIGGEKQALKIELNPEKLKEHKITLYEVESALKNNNGRIILGDINNNESLSEITINTSIKNPQDAKNIIIKNGVFLSDIAKIYLGYAEKKSFTSILDNKNFQIKNNIFIEVAKKNGVNSNDIIEKTNNILSNFSNDNIKIKNIRDLSKISSNAINGLGINLIQSIIIVNIILLFFLGRRSAFLVAIVIPLSLLSVFGIGYFFDQTINKITLFALILSLGLLVDSAIVIVENIYRHLNINDERSKIKKIIDAVGEVSTGLLLSTITSVIVFLPLTQITGMMGPYMGPLAFFVPFALIISFIIAIIITPFLSNYFLQNKKYEINNTLKSISLNSGIQIPKVQKIIKLTIFEKIQNQYAKVLSYILKNNKSQNIIIFLTIIFLLIGFSFVPLKLVHFQMLPKDNNKTLWITLDMQEGTSFYKTNTVANNIVKEIKNIDDIENIAIFTGNKPSVDFNGLFKGFNYRQNENQSSILVSFKDEKIFSSSELATKIRSKVSHLKNQYNTNIKVLEDPPGPPVFSTLIIKIIGDNLDKNNKISQWLQKTLHSIEGIVDIDSSTEHQYIRHDIYVNHKKAKENKISAYDIFRTLNLSIDPKNIGSLSLKNTYEDAIIELSILKNKRNSIEDISSIYIKNNNEKMIKLSEIINIKNELSSISLLRENHNSKQEIYAEMENKSIVYGMIDLIYKIFEEYEVKQFSLYGMTIIDPSTTKEIQLEWGGEFEMTLDNFRDLLIAMGIAFLLIYSILVGQFKSFITPLLILITIPLSLIGILFGFALLDFLNNTLLTATALIGFIALMGIVVNNSIIYIEYLQILLKEKIPLKEALVMSGKTRLRPILITSITTILGSLTVASSPVWSGLAWAIVFGLSISSILTLIIFPILFFKLNK
jgi:multidrug efflux pump subunit AcrB